MSKIAKPGIKPDDEYQLRKFMRLDRDRLQSNNLVEAITNKVKNAKEKQIAALRKQKEDEFSKFNTDKLNDFQNYMKSGLPDVDMAKFKTKLGDEDELMNQKEVKQNSLAKRRGRMAMEKQRLLDNERMRQQTESIERMKRAKEMANSRSMQKKSSKGKFNSASTTNTFEMVDIVDVVGLSSISDAK